MKYRRLGKTNLKVSVVGIGTWQYGGEWGKNFDEGEVKKILDRGFDLGFNLRALFECSKFSTIQISFFGLISSSPL